jgi:molybdopterin-guanine dinucleotide biosynthesis protein A
MTGIISSKLTAAIIAGGESRRFGNPKALARLGSRALIDFSIDIARAISETIVLNFAEADIFRGREIPLVKDIFPGCGPLGGIHTVLQHVNTSWVAILPCDLPLLDPRVYRVLFERRKNNRPVVTLSEQGLEPLISIWPVTALFRVEKFIMQGNYKLHFVLKELQAVEVFIPEHLPDYSPEIFFNVNRKEDLEKIRDIFDKSAKNKVANQ